MSFLHIYHEADGEQPLLSTHEGERIAAELTAIRLFTNTEGWVANMTGSPIASRFPRFEALCGDRIA